ncbi:MAG: glycosyltransferase family 4 protein [Halanaerobiales bacterium]
MSRIKVLHIITRLANGGADENTLFTIKGLDFSSYDLDLMIGEENDPIMMNNLKLPKEVKLYKVKGLRRDISPYHDLLALFRIYRIIRAGNYDIVHTHIAKAGILGRLAAKMAGVPIIIHGIHGTTFPDTIHPLKQRLFRDIEKFTARYTDFFIPVGEDMKEKYIKAGVGKREQYQTVYSGMELNKFTNASNYTKKKREDIRTSLGIDQDQIVIGNVSKIQQRKGFTFYLDLAKKITDEYDNVVFLIVGSGPNEEQIKRKSEEMGLTDKVIFTGYRTDVEDIFAIFDVKVLTSLWEGLPRVLVQAAAVGKPIVTFDVDGAWEIVEEGKNGFIVPMKNVDAMNEKVRQLIEDDNLRKKMGLNSYKKVSELWTVEKMVTDIDHIYQKLYSKNLKKNNDKAN